MKNLELKIALNKNNNNVVNLLKRSKAIYKGMLKQTDIYYNCSSARLKIREINNADFELILYKRPDKNRYKFSDYQIIKLTKKQALEIKIILNKLFGKKKVIKKERELWLYKHTRIHIDKVFGIGNFLELETVLKKINEKRARIEYKEIIEKLNLEKYKRCRYFYSDMAK